MPNAKELVSLDRFVHLMNETLHQHPDYQQGMKFVNVGTGYELIADMLTIMQNQSLDKEVFDRVSLRYSISR